MRTHQVMAAVKSVIACAIFALGSVAQANAEEKTPEIPKQIMSMFDGKTDTPPKREYLGKTELYNLLSKHPVFCDGSHDGLYECTQVFFDSDTTGRLHSQTQINKEAKATIYQETPFNLSDDGLCTTIAATDLSIKVSGNGNSEISRLSQFLSEYIYALDYYVTDDCLKFTHPGTKSVEQSAPTLDQYEVFRLTNGQWKTDKNPTPTTFYETWTMATGSFKVTKLISRKVSSEELFTKQVAIFGQKAIVGTTGSEDRKSAAHVFDVKTGKQTSELTIKNRGGPQPLAATIAISDKAALLGAQDTKGNMAGIYLFDITTGQQTGQFAITDDKTEQFDDPSYAPVGISGSTAMVGLRDFTKPEGKFGSVIYLLDTATGKLLAELVPSSGIDKNTLIGSAAISGNRAILGAPYGAPGAPRDDGGAAYLFNAETGKLIAKLIPDMPSSYYGRDVAISGNTAIVSAPFDSEVLIGAAYLFDTTTGKQIAKLTAGNAAGRGIFGSSVAISGSTAVVGATGMDLTGDGAYARGSAYVFDVSTGSQISWITAGNKTDGRSFGALAGVAGDSILIRSLGAAQGEEVADTVYLFQPEQ
ncbi:MAG: hypothetical protein Kilf2KO_06800 [Rhodospirillales bacterium]